MSHPVTQSTDPRGIGVGDSQVTKSQKYSDPESPLKVKALELVTFTGNVLWFGAASYFFTRGGPKFIGRHTQIIHKAHQAPVVYTVKFLGGMNFALCLLSALRLLRRLATQLPDPADKDILFCASVAHFSQWLFNVGPFYRTYIRGGRVPLKFSKEMLFIFIIDGLMALLNFVVARSTRKQF